LTSLNQISIKALINLYPSNQLKKIFDRKIEQPLFKTDILIFHTTWYNFKLSQSTTKIRLILYLALDSFFISYLPINSSIFLISPRTLQLFHISPYFYVNKRKLTKNPFFKLIIQKCELSESTDKKSDHFRSTYILKFAISMGDLRSIVYDWTSTSNIFERAPSKLF
jgi:hypothetical protein